MIPTIVQLPCDERYTIEWYARLKKHPGFDVLGIPWRISLDRTKSYNYFTNLEDAIFYEVAQIVSLLYRSDGMRSLLTTDLDFPGALAGLIPALKLKYPQMKIYGIYHAGSWCNGDIFETDQAKKHLEISTLRSCAKVFVSTTYHKRLINEHLGDDTKVVVLNGLPFYPDQYEECRHVEKIRDVLVLGRPEQCSREGLQSEWECHWRPIDHDQYIKKLARYKVVVIPKSEETFGYAALEVFAVGALPVVPDAFAFQETVPSALRYRDTKHLPVVVQRALSATSKQIASLRAEANLHQYEDVFDKIHAYIQGDQ